MLGSARCGFQLSIELCACLTVVAGQHQIDDWPLKNSFPEAPPPIEVLEAAHDFLSIAPDEGGDPAVGGRQQRLKPCLDHATQDR